MKSTVSDLEQFIHSAVGSRFQAAGPRISGPRVSIDQQAAAVLAPVLQEIVSDMTTDVRPQRDVDLAISWSCDDKGCCVIEVSDGADLSTARTSDGMGVGSWGLSSNLSGGSREGMMRCEMSESGARIIVPARYVCGGQIDSRQHVALAVAPADPLTGRSVLVVEDQLVIALDLEMLLREEGAVSVHLSGSVEDALGSMASDPPDIAILDVNLGSTTSFPVARELQRRDIPFIFATGYGNEVQFPRELSSVPLVAKPYCVETIRKALLSVYVVHA